MVGAGGEVSIASELAGAAIIGVVAISVLVLAEVLKRTTGIATELTRKFAHIGSGVAVLLIPVVIDSSWTVLALAAGFAGLLFVTHATGLLQAVHGVGRGVGGVLWYPVTAWLVYAIVFDARDGVYLEFAMPVLVLACADAVGAVVGKRWGRHRYEVAAGHYRSWEGSAAFFVVAVACIWIPLAVGLGEGAGHALLVAMLVALLATGFEGISVHGLDNVLVPFGTLLFIDRFRAASDLELALQLVLVASVVAATVAVRFRRPATGGGVMTFALSIYTLLVLGGWAWLPPLVGLVAVFVAYERSVPVDHAWQKRRYELGTAMIGLATPIMLVLLHTALTDPAVRDALYVAYLASIATQGAVLAFIAPQHRSFRFRRVRRALAVRDPWQHRATVPKVAAAVAAAAATLVVPTAALGGVLPGDGLVAGAPGPHLLVAMALCVLGLATFALLAATACVRRSCPACGNVTLHGLGCCHDLDLGVGDTRSLKVLTFRKAYLLANLTAAVAATGVLAWPT